MFNKFVITACVLQQTSQMLEVPVLKIDQVIGIMVKSIVAVRQTVSRGVIVKSCV